MDVPHHGGSMAALALLAPRSRQTTATTETASQDRILGRIETPI
jgi:hypothetical protein